jgi:nicotinamide-nucleotide amidase
VNAEVVAVGSELLLGQIVDTNSAVIARHFAAIGLDLFYKTTVGDNLQRLSAALRQALGRSDVVLTTGGIGPTADDVTREAVAEATGRDLVFSEELWRQIEAFFSARGMAASASNRRQAFLPRGALAVENPLGTAPAFILELGDRTIVTLPGVPREMEHLLGTRVVPYLRRRLGLRGEIRLRVLRTVGLGESRIGERLADFMERGANPTVGTLAHLGQVDVRIAAKAEDRQACEALIAPVEAEIRRRLGDHVFGADDATLEGVVGDRLRALGAAVAVVEGGTAGLVAARLAPVAGTALAAALVLPDAAAAPRLGLQVVGADAEQRAGQLAAEAAKWAGAGVGAAVLIGPADDPPSAMVAAAVSLNGETRVRTWRLGGDPASTRVRAAVLLLDHLRRALPPAHP